MLHKMKIYHVFVTMYMSCLVTISGVSSDSVRAPIRRIFSAISSSRTIAINYQTNKHCTSNINTLTSNHLANPAFPVRIRIQDRSSKSDCLGTQAKCLDNICTSTDTTVYINLCLVEDVWSTLSQFIENVNRSWCTGSLISGLELDALQLTQLVYLSATVI